ncbi:MAG: cytochrome c [Pyrinomonadaceae bacterium]
MTKSMVLMIICCAALALAVACTQTAPTPNSNTPMGSPPAATNKPAATPDEMAVARAAYQKNCESCHGESGEGGLVKVDNKRLKVPSLKADHAIKNTDEQLAKQITNGGDGMPSFKAKLKPEEIQQLVQYVRKQFQGK